MKMFEFKDVVFSHDEIEVLKRIRFDIEAGKRTAIVGPNGAGKSTLLYHLNGLYQQSSGEIYFKNNLLDKKKRKTMASEVGIVFQDPDDQIISLTVHDDIAFGPEQLGVERDEIEARVEKYLSLLSIENLSERNPSELSYGQKKYVTISGILAMETEVFILDEPMAFLDPRGKNRMIEILEQLHELGKTIIVTTHDMQFVAEWAEAVIVICDGECLGKFTPAELFESPEVLKQAHLNLPPTYELLKSFWQSEWGPIPLKVKEAKEILSSRLETAEKCHFFNNV